MTEAHVRTLRQVRQVLAGTQAMEFQAAAEDAGRYAWIEAVLERYDCSRLAEPTVALYGAAAGRGALHGVGVAKPSAADLFRFAVPPPWCRDFLHDLSDQARRKRQLTNKQEKCA